MAAKTQDRIIEAKEYKVADLFGEHFIFYIPIYQRPFSWDRDNFNDMVDDFKDAITQDVQHFLGSSVLQEISEKRYNVVDGQQRLTALTILMAVVRDLTSVERLKESMQSYIFQKEDVYKEIPATMRVSPWSELRDTFLKYVYTPGGTTKFHEEFLEDKIRYKDTEDPRYHLFEAIDVFQSSLKEESENLEAFVKHLLNDVYMVCIRTKNLTSAFRLFSVLNTRGLPLEPSDVLKSENLEAAPDDKREECAKIWRSLEEDLGREELSKVIAHIRTIKKKEKAKLGIYEEYEEIFKKGDITQGVPFFQYVKDVSNIYDEKILSASLKTSKPEDENWYKVTIDLMNRFIPFADWIPPVLAFCQKHRSDAHLLDFLKKLEKKVVVEWAAGFSLTERITSLSKTIKMLEEVNDPQQAVGKTLTYKPGEETKSREIDFTKPEEIKSYLLPKLNETRFYSLNGGKFAKYILLRIDMEMWDLENFPGYPGVVTVEHVLPQTPSTNSEWNTTLFTDKERDKWTNSLGNLVLLSGRKNSKAQNYEFAKKKEVYFKEKSTPFRLTQELEKVGVWNAQKLSERHGQLVEKALQIYS